MISEGTKFGISVNLLSISVIVVSNVSLVAVMYHFPSVVVHLCVSTLMIPLIFSKLSKSETKIGNVPSFCIFVPYSITSVDN